MTNPALILRHLCFVGPDKPPARLDFGVGLNVIYGASDTGKSFVLEAIDFMLGGRGPLRDIPERIGYDRIFLGVEATASGGKFTLARAVNGGPFQLYDGLRDVTPADLEPTILSPVHSSKKDSNVSRFLLRNVGLDGKLVRVKASNETRSLSFRDLCHLSLVSETDIQKQGSPLETPQYSARTAEYSIFKLLLTGVDDSALISAARDTAASQSRAVKIELIDELVANFRQKLAESEEDPDDLGLQLERLTASIAREKEALNSSEKEYQALVERRNDLRRRLDNGVERRAEIGELQARFTLLDEQYRSDLARLAAIREAGSLMAALPPQTCPLCGAAPEQQSRDDDCDGNLEDVVTAADAESTKIVRLLRELGETVGQLAHEAQSFNRLIPRMREEKEQLDADIQALRPDLMSNRATYAELVEEKSSVNSSLAIFDQLVDLQSRKEALAGAPEGESASAAATTDLSTTTLDLFAQQVEKLLKEWHFPEAERAHFERSDRDLVIQGKPRSSRGKGMRAITHAAFTVGLMEFCKALNRQHVGFVIMDSPLLAYRAPEGPDDDLSGTDVQDRFYQYLAATTERQIIIIENTDPPASVIARPSTQFFSKNPHQGRYGFFPPLG